MGGPASITRQSREGARFGARLSTGPGKGAATDGYEGVACGELVCRPVGRQRRNGKKQQKRGKPLLKPGGSESPRQTKGQAGWKSERLFGAAKDGADTVFQGTRWFLKPENEKKKKQRMEVEEGKSVEQEENVAWNLEIEGRNGHCRTIRRRDWLGREFSTGPAGVS